MAQEGYVSNLYGNKLLGDLSFVLVQATVAGGSGAPTRDAAVSSPGTTIARNSAGQYTVTFPACAVVHPLDASTVLAEQAGSRGYFETMTPSLNNGTGTGTVTIEFAVTPGTAAEVADDTRICVALLCGNV